MNFAGALFALERGHKVKRHHWTGYWFKDRDRIIMHTYKGDNIDLQKTNDIFYTLSNCACDDWEIIEDWNKETTQPDCRNDNAVKVLDAYWIDNADSYICSNCGYESGYIELACPHCGSRMTNAIKEGTK